MPGKDKFAAAGNAGAPLIPAPAARGYFSGRP
jgi:hypothetical protein